MLDNSFKLLWNHICTMNRLISHPSLHRPERFFRDMGTSNEKGELATLVMELVIFFGCKRMKFNKVT